MYFGSQLSLLEPAGFRVLGDVQLTRIEPQYIISCFVFCHPLGFGSGLICFTAERVLLLEQPGVQTPSR